MNREYPANSVLIQGQSERQVDLLGKRSNWKKAYVRVQEGQVIDFLGGESL